MIAAALISLVVSALLLAPRFRDEAGAPVAQGTSESERAPSSATLPTVSSSPPAPSASLSAHAEPARQPPPPPAPSPGDEVCPFDMLYVEGIWCPFVSHRCEEYLGPNKKKRRASVDRCARYRDTRLCEGRPHELKFCIDRFEYPNLEAVKPAVMVTYPEAERACRAEGKRLCMAMEWSYGCEGKYTQPYTTGLVRDAGACNIDRRPKTPNPAALRTPFDVSAELERLDQRAPSGSLSKCVSPFGVQDTTGNVAEWVNNTDGRPHWPPYRSALAGGHWARAVATCRLLDAQHDQRYRSPRAGFRCCSDALDGRPRRRLMRKDFRLRKKRPITQ